MSDRRTLVIGLFSAIALAACHLLAALDDEPGVLPSDAGVEASVTDPCAHVQPVGPPLADDSTDGAVVMPDRFVLAIDKAALVPEVGYDLDGVCTCDRRPGSARGGARTCTPPMAPSSKEDPTCDPDGGVDNKLAKVAEDQGLGEEINKRANAIIGAGQRTLLIQLIDYNGLANDTEIVVGVLPAEGIREDICDAGSTFQEAGSTNDAGGTWSPGRCGNDTWSIAELSAVGLVPTVVGKGHVNDFQLVAQFEAGKTVHLPFTIDTSLELQGMVITGTLVPLDATLRPRDKTRGPGPDEGRLFRLDGTLAGRAAVKSVLTTVGTSRLGGKAFCTLPNFENIRSTICSSLDITVTAGEDPTGRCDALSTAVRFTAIPALQGEPVAPPAAPTVCEDVDATNCQ